MTKYICDKCGKETKNKETIEIKYKDWLDPECRKTYELCDKCMEALCEFITGWRVVR